MYKDFKNKKSNCCLICFKAINRSINFSFFIEKKIICDKCEKGFKEINKEIKINGISTLFLYEYNDFIKEIIYRYKGCYDYVLKDVFFYKYKNKLKRKYKGYTIIFPPSNVYEDKKRKFQHVKELANILKLKTEDLFYKCKEYKQSANNFKNRKEIKNIIKLNGKITNKKYLVIDDIYTSGNTLITIYDFLFKNGVDKEKIKGLIVAKVHVSVEL